MFDIFSFCVSYLSMWI